MTDTYEELIRARAANMQLMILANDCRAALVALVKQPFSKTCIARAKEVVLRQIDTEEAQRLADEFLEMKRLLDGAEDEAFE